MAVYTTIDDPTLHFQAKIYTGTGSSHAVTFDGDTDMSPDMVWIKARNHSYDHRLVDTVRGATKEIYPDLTSAEATDAEGVKTFDSNGFTLGTTAAINSGSSKTFVSWNWKAGGSTATNSSGDITSTVSVNTTSKFSIVSYEGNKTDDQTVGHSLGVVPEMIITKPRDISDNWGVYHKSMGNTHGLYLNTNAAKIDSVAYWSDADPTSTLVTLGENEATNDDESMIMYAFAPVQGYSKFGSFVSNDTVDNTFVYCGFKPALLMAKTTTSTNDWVIFDNKRDPHNVTQHKLYPDLDNAEATSENDLDFLSNGFKFRNRYGANTLVYMAFAESPFVNSKGVPNNAR